MMDSQLPQHDLAHDTLMGLPELEEAFEAYSSTSVAISTPCITTSDSHSTTESADANYPRKYPHSRVIGAKSVFSSQYVIIPVLI